MGESLLSFVNVGFRYQKSQCEILKGLNFSINQGDYIAIVGTSGSGKSTLLSLLGLLNQPSSGVFKILGVDTANLTLDSVAQLKNNEIGFVFQNFNLLNHMTVFDNVALPLTYNRAVKRKMYQEKVHQALMQVGMLDFAKRKPTQLSGGQQQRVAIARALVNDPSLILADEPTGNLDSENSALIFALLAEFNQQGKTICLITHDLSYAKQAKQQWQIQDGCLTCHQKI